MQTAVTVSVPLLFICAGLLIAFSVIFVRPYVIISAYCTTKCRPINVTDHGIIECTCNDGDEDSVCRSEFPCMEIEVEFSLVKSNSTQRGRLFQYYQTYNINEKCSMTTCDYLTSRNARLVTSFVKKYGNTDDDAATYTCFYNPEAPREVILEKTPKTTVIMAMFWPSLIFVICAIIVVAFYCGPDSNRRVKDEISTLPESEEMVMKE